VYLVRTDVSEKRTASVIRVESISELDTTLAVFSNKNTAKNHLEAIRSSETSVLTRATRRHIAEDGIPHSHNRENLKSHV
jgi:hypothetical protein